MPVRKAVFPAAGWGTRFLPATKAQPKEMLPIVDKPCIQLVIEEAIHSGVTQITLVTSQWKKAIEDHFDTQFELEELLRGKKKADLLAELARIDELTNGVTFVSVRQRQALGLGHAILVTKAAIGNEPFAVLLGDDLIYNSGQPALGQMIDVYEQKRASVIAIMEVPPSETHHYGIIDGEQVAPNLYRIRRLVEKPKPSEAPSNLAVIGRYVLTPTIFPYLEKTAADSRGEIQLTDALDALLGEEPIYGYVFEGKRYDAGNKLGFLKATVEYALRDANLGADFGEYLKALDVESVK